MESTQASLTSEAGACENCGGGTGNHEGPQAGGLSYVFAVGRIEPRFPSLGVEKEFAQAAGRGGNAGLTDRQALHATLTNRDNRYLARRLCWVLTIEGMETYLLQPRESADLDTLVDAVRADPDRGDADVVIGVRGPIAPPELCNGLMLPIVFFDQIYSFGREELISAIPRPEQLTKKDDKQFRAAAGQVFDSIIQIADNAGATDEHRALNYLAVRYPRIYAQAAEAFDRNLSMTGVEVWPSRLSGVRKIVDVIFSYTHRETDVTERYFVRVDVTEEFPFLVSKLAPFYQR